MKEQLSKKEALMMLIVEYMYNVYLTDYKTNSVVDLEEIVEKEGYADLKENYDEFISDISEEIEEFVSSKLEKEDGG